MYKRWTQSDKKNLRQNQIVEKLCLFQESSTRLFSDWTTDYEPKLLAGRDGVDDFKCGRRLFFVDGVKKWSKSDESERATDAAVAATLQSSRRECETHDFFPSDSLYVVEGSDLLCRLFRDATKEELKAKTFVDFDDLGVDGWRNLVAIRRFKMLQAVGAIYDGCLDG